MDSVTSQVRAKVKGYLAAGQEPRIALQNLCSKTGEAGESWLIATDSTLLIGTQSLAGELEFEAYPLAKITGIERSSHGLGRGKLAFVSGTECLDELEYSALDSDKFQTVDQQILALVRKAGGRPAPVPPAGTAPGVSEPVEAPATAQVAPPVVEEKPAVVSATPQPTPPRPKAKAAEVRKPVVPPTGRRIPEKRRPPLLHPKVIPGRRGDIRTAPPAAPVPGEGRKGGKETPAVLRPAGGKGSPHIVLLLPGTTFTPGELVPCHIRIRQPRSVFCRGVRLHLRGAEETRISHGSGKNRSTHREKVILVDEEHVLFGRHSNPAGENFADALGKLFSSTEYPQLSTGEHTWETRFMVPQSTPPTYEGRCGTVRYSLKAYVDIPLSFDTAKHVGLTVVPEEGRRRYRFVRYESRRSRFRELAPGPGDIRLEVELEEYTWGADDRIRGRIRFSNPRRREVRGLKVDAELVEEAHADSHVRVNKINTKRAYSRIGFNEAEFPWRGFSVPAPAGGPPFGGKILRVDLLVKVALDLPWKGNVQAGFMARPMG